MKIAFVGGFAWQPKATVKVRAFPLAVELVRKGHKVTIFLVPYDNPLESGKTLVAEGVQIVNIVVGRKPKIRHAPLLASRLCQAIKDYSPDITHVFKPKGYAGAACTWLLLKGCHSVVLDSDDWEGWGGFNDLKKYPWLIKEFIDRQEKWLLRRTPVVTVASRALEEKAIALRKSAQGVVYIPNGGVSRDEALVREGVLASACSESKQSFGLPEGPIIFYNGHFNPEEDGMFFCRAAGPVARRTGSTLVLVGEGPEIPKLKDFLASQNGVAVRFFPRLPYAEFMRLIAVSDVTAFPYPDNPIHRSKCSTRIIDYMCAGKPVLTSAVGQNTDYITDGETGVLVPPGDEARFAIELEKLVRDKDLRTRLGQNARQRILDTFSWSGVLVDRCLTAYEQLPRS